MSRRLSVLFTLICITLVAWFLAQATFFLRGTSLESPNPASRQAERTSAEPESIGAFNAITTRNLLGVSAIPPEERPGLKKREANSHAEKENLSTSGIDALPVSKLGWKLLGTIVATDKETSRAIIQVDGTDLPYREGETLRGWKIALVQRRTVVLAKGGTRERLSINDDALLPKDVPRPDEKKSVSRLRLQKELGDINALMHTLSVSPQTVGGYQGLQVTSIQPGSYMEELGLRKDDLLLEADGNPLQSFGDLGALGELASKEAITLEILRDGKKTIIRYDIQS